MSIFNIPQFIDTEDKIAGPLTAKQLGLLIAASVTVFLVYLLFGKAAAFIMALPVLLFFGAFAFYKPNGQPLMFIAGAMVTYLFQPKLYTWKRLPDESPARKKEPAKAAAESREKKTLTAEKISEISELIDSPKKQTAGKTYGSIALSGPAEEKSARKAEAKVKLISSSRLTDIRADKSADKFKKIEKAGTGSDQTSRKPRTLPKRKTRKRAETRIRFITSPEEEEERKKYGNITFK